MNPGGKGGGKHWTKKEIEAREEAEIMLTRNDEKKSQRLRVPDWLSNDAKKIWKQTLERVRGLELFDKMDTDMLAIYCDVVAKYQNTANDIDSLDEDFDKQVKALQAWARLATTYAEKLGLTPAARARLVKKKADEKIRDEFSDQFD
jgi:P27 family predicted phage terminase small subunit